MSEDLVGSVGLGWGFEFLGSLAGEGRGCAGCKGD